MFKVCDFLRTLSYSLGVFSMPKIANTILCYGIAMILLFFGMSFDEAEALFYTQNVRTESVVTAVCSGSATIYEVESEITQIVGTTSESPIQQLTNQSSAGKKDSRLHFCILLVDNLLDNYSNFDKAICVMKSLDVYHSVAVLNYIHDLDGKKRV